MNKIFSKGALLLIYAFILIISVAILYFINGKPGVESIIVTVPALILVSVITVVYQNKLSLKNLTAFIPLIFGILLAGMNFIFEARNGDPGAVSDFPVIIIANRQIITFLCGVFLSCITFIYYFVNDKKEKP